MRPLIKSFHLFVYNYWLVLFVLLFVGVTYASLSPLPKLPVVPGKDKTLHLLAYAAFSFPLFIRYLRHWGWVFMVLLCYGALIEWVQPFVNRYGEWEDLLANGLGILL